MFKGIKFWLIILIPIIAIAIFGRIKMIVDGESNHLMNASNETVIVALTSENDGEDYEFIVEPNSEKVMAIKADIYHLIVENQEGEELRNTKSYNLESMEEDERYIDLLGNYVYFVIDINAFYLKFYEDSEGTYLDELFEDETYKEVFYGETPFYLDTNMDIRHYSVGEEIPLEMGDDEIPILILPFEIKRFERLTDDELILEAIDYVYDNLEKEE